MKKKKQTIGKMKYELKINYFGIIVFSKEKKMSNCGTWHSLDEDKQGWLKKN